VRIRNVKSIQRRSRSNQVHPLGNGRYQVVSGRSYNVYDVTLRADGGVCSCHWAKHRLGRDRRSACSHVLAAINFAAQEAGATSVSAWNSAQDAQRQHRRTIDIGDGVLVTVRRERKHGEATDPNLQSLYSD
jgi:hypothetical protein